MLFLASPRALGRQLPSSGLFPSEDDVCRCLHASVDKMLEKHAMLFNGMVARIGVSADTDLAAGFRDMSDELFSQNEVREGERGKTRVVIHSRLKMRPGQLKGQIL